MSPKLKLKKANETPEKSTEELFDASPLPGDRYASPSVNKLAKSIFKAPPGSNPTVSLNEGAAPVAMSIETEPVMLDATRNLETSFESTEAEPSAPVAEGSRSTTPVSAASASAARSAEKPQFQVGDVVWAQTDIQFPFWAGIVVDASLLPEDLQQAFNFTTRNGKSSKVPVYFFARNDYDVVSQMRMKDYKRNRATLKDQVQISGSLYPVFRRGIRYADECVTKEPAARIEWVVKLRADGGKDGTSVSVARTGSTSNLSSRSSSRASSMHIHTTESGEAVAGAAATLASAQHAISPGSENNTPLSGLTIGSSIDSGRIPSRFTFPDHAVHSSTQPSTQLDTVPECPSVSSDVALAPTESPEDPSLSTHATSGLAAIEHAAHAGEPTSEPAVVAPEVTSEVTAGTVAAQHVDEHAAGEIPPLPHAGVHVPTLSFPPAPATGAAEGSELGSDTYEMVDLQDAPESARSATAPLDRDRLDSLAFSNAVSHQSSELFTQLEDENDPFGGPSRDGSAEQPARSPPAWQTSDHYIGAVDALSPHKPRTPPRNIFSMTEGEGPVSPFTSPSKSEHGGFTPEVSTPAPASSVSSTPQRAEIGPEVPTLTLPPNKGVPARPVADAASLFGDASAPPLPHSARASAPPPRMSDASALFGGGGAADAFGTVPPPAPAAPVRERVTSGGRAAVVATGGRGLFDSAPAAADGLFGTPPGASDFMGAAPAIGVPPRPASTKVVATAAASDLFGSAPYESSPFGAAPSAAPVVAARPPPAAVSTAGVFDSAPAPSAAGLFGAPPSVQTTAQSSVGRSPPRPGLNDAAALFGGGAPVPAGDPFSFAGTSSSAPPPAPPVVAARAQQANVTAADLFGAPPGGATIAAADAFGPPPAKAMAMETTADVFSAVPPPSAPVRQESSSAASTTESVTGSSYDMPSPPDQSSGEFVSPPSVSAPEVVAPAIAADPRKAAASDASALFGAPAKSADWGVAPTVPAVHIAAPAPATRAATTDHPAAASATGLPAQPDLRRTSSSGPVFKGKAKVVSGASPFDAAEPANTADKLFAAPSVGAGVASGPFDSGVSGARGSAGAANPFAASAGASDLFGAAPHSDAAAAFSTAPAVRGTSVGASADLFSSPPPGGSAVFGSPPPSSVAGLPSAGKAKSTKNNKANLSAVDVFSAAPPVEKSVHAVMIDPFAPPAAPGVKTAPKTAAPSVPVAGAAPLPFGTAPVPPSVAGAAAVGAAPASLSLSFPPGTLPSSVPAGVPSSPFTPTSETAPSTTARKPPVPAAKVKKAPPPGMIATPHGYVPIASLQPAGNTGAAGDASPASSVGAVASKPLVNHNVLTSLVTETAPEPVAPAPEPVPVTADPAATAGAPPTARGPVATVGPDKAAPVRQRYQRPPAAVVAFGFGGKVVTSFPRENRLSMPVFNPVYGVPVQPLPQDNGPKFYAGPVRVRTLIDLVRREVQRGDAHIELQEMTRLLTLFSGPITTAATAESASDDSTSVAIREELQRRIECPLSTIIPANKGAVNATTAASEKLLWALLKLCVERGGVLSSDSDSPEGLPAGLEGSTPEMKIAQLLMGHAVKETTVVAGGAASVKVFSAAGGNAYTPDMGKSKDLHAAHQATAGAAPMSVTAEQYVEIESLLVVGKKEEALKKAIQYGEWSLALLVGSVCGAEKYQEVIRGYSASHFPPSAPLHLLTLLFANQGATAVLSTAKTDDALTMWRHNLSSILSNKTSNWQQLATYLGYRLQSEAKDIYAAHAAYLCAGAYPTFPSTAGGVVTGLRHTGGSASTYSSNDSLHGHENARVSTAELESQAAKLAGKYSLLGCDVTLPKHRGLTDCLSMAALRGTEILEYTLHKRLAIQVAAASMGKSPSVDGIASFGKSLTDIFSWKGSNSAAGGSGGSAVPPKSPKQGASSGSAGGNAASASAAAGADKNAPAAVSNALRYRIMKVKAVLCPLKVRFAMVLADFGLVKEALAYAIDAKNAVNEIGVSEERKRPSSPKAGGSGGSSGSGSGTAGTGKPRSNSGSSTNEWGVKSFNRSFVRALDEFLDRLGAGDKIRAPPQGGAGAGGAHKRDSSTGSGVGGLWGSVMSSINLKELVDGMTDGPPPPTVGPPPTGPMKGPAAGPPPTGAAAGGGPSNASTLWPATPPAMPGTVAPPAPEIAGPPPTRNSMPRPTAPPASYATMSALPPRPGNMNVPPSTGAGGYPGGAAPGPAGPFGSAPAATSAPAAASAPGNNADSGFFEVDLGGDQGGNSSGFFDDTGYPPHNSNYPAHASSGPCAAAPSPYSTMPPPAGSSSAAPQPNNSAGNMWGGAGNHNAAPAPQERGYPSAAPAPTPAASIAPSASTGSFFGFGGSSAAPAAPAPAPAPATTAPAKPAATAAPPASSRPAAAAAADEDSGKGLMGVVRKGLLKYLYPDAHDASSNIGKSLEAVYNKETGRWEFPGEDNGTPSPASLPPPTGPIGGGSSGGNSGANSLGVSPSPSMSAFGNVGGPPGGGGGGPPPTMGGGGIAAANNDPLAMLMAPPQRRMPVSHSTPSMSDGGDPLAALMAPPSMRYNMPPPSMASSASMPAINVWKPPPVAAPAPAPAAPAMVPEGDGSNEQPPQQSSAEALGPPPM